MVTEPTLRAACEPVPTEDLVSWLGDTLVGLGWEYNSYSVEPGHPVTLSDGAPENVRDVYLLAAREGYFSIGFSKRFSEGDWGAYVSVDRRRYQECVSVTLHAIKRVSDGVRDDFLNTAVAVANDSRTLALAADIGDGVPAWHRLPSNHEFSPKDPYPGVFDDSFDVQMANLTLFPPGAVSDTDPQTLAEHGQVIRTASGPLLIACENVLACRERQRERIADALGVGTAGY